MQRRTIGLVLLILGALALVVGGSGIGLDLAGLGDQTGLDVVDLIPLTLGLLLAGAGGSLVRRS